MRAAPRGNRRGAIGRATLLHRATTPTAVADVGSAGAAPARDAHGTIRFASRAPGNEVWAAGPEAMTASLREQGIETVEVDADEDAALDLSRGVRPLVMVGRSPTRTPSTAEGPPRSRRADLFEGAIGGPTGWNASVAPADRGAAPQASAAVDPISNPSRFLFPRIRAALGQRDARNPEGEEGHVIPGGLDGAPTARRLIGDGRADATGVRGVFSAAGATASAFLEAVEARDASLASRSTTRASRSPTTTSAGAGRTCGAASRRPSGERRGGRVSDGRAPPLLPGGRGGRHRRRLAPALVEPDARGRPPRNAWRPATSTRPGRGRPRAREAGASPDPEDAARSRDGPSRSAPMTLGGARRERDDPMTPCVARGGW